MTAEELSKIVQDEKEANSVFTHTVNVCVAAGCMSSHSDQALDALQKAAKAKGVDGKIKVKGVGCMGLCAAGPLVQIRDNQTGEAQVMYQYVQPEDAGELLDRIGQAPLKRLVCDTTIPFFARHASDRA